MPNNTPELPPPLALAMIICDSTYLDATTGKRSLLGIHSVQQSYTFPTRIQQLGVYIAITEGYG